MAKMGVRLTASGDGGQKMDTQVVKRADDRRDLKNSYVEYTAPAKGLARFFKREQKRGLIVNLSKGGVAFRTGEPLAEGTQLAVGLIFPGGKARVQAKIEVRWVREERKIGTITYTHVVGARFTEYSPEAWEQLNRVLREAQA